jgi:hypothetical protein
MNLELGDTQLIIREAIKHGLSLHETAYVLATAYHETAHTMKPVREYGGEKYLKNKKYYPYVGMGYVQLTWKRNYELASKKFGVDFVANPKLLLEPKYAAPILVVGMKEGWFTAKSLKDYIDSVDEPDKEDLREFANARRIINGVDKQVEIGKIALEYEQALKNSGYGQKQPQKPVQEVPKVEAPITSEKATTLLSVLLRLIRMFLK